MIAPCKSTAQAQSVMEPALAEISVLKTRQKHHGKPHSRQAEDAQSVQVM